MRVLDAVGFPWVLVETVGVGQVEVEVAGAADTTVVVVNPGWGDSVQANKAGLLEVADVFVVNKADRPGAGDTRADLEQMLDLSEPTGGWRPPILATVGTTGEGVAELWKAIGDHQEHLAASGRVRASLDPPGRGGPPHRGRDVGRAGAQEVWASADLAAMRAGLADRSIDPWSAADRILARV